jgi:methionyl-tRNA synthetase
LTVNNIELPYILPTNIPANEFLNLEGRKFSTSRGRAVWLADVVEQYHSDYIRYYLTTIIPETQDSDFKRKEFQDKCNNLCDTLGNLHSRGTNLILKYID